ncbi:ABC transporter related protein [Paenibacillus curdlanolyticus YK9]|uniref:ABC transporter related protein n=1 Tax=Paenibacillus curdlanolyticus YK9 TaxID=717606 RepID=E0I667_9BACL|nr:ABC transporter ATP-binding protein [Paenibacillus curdlanolyticus]EFM12459.1 ABC transporter related protein [Paenibacillus curdlanolyticus YK9]
MSLFRKYRSQYGRSFLIAVVFLMFEALADLLQPAILAIIIDKGVLAGDMRTVYWCGSLMLLVTALGAVSALIRNLLSSRVSQRFGAELRADLYEKMQTLPTDELDRLDRASLITRLTNDVTQIQNFVNGLMRIFVKAPLLGIGAVIMAVRLNPPMSIILIAIVPIVAFLIAMNLRIGFPRFARVQEALDRMNGYTRDFLSGIRVVKAFNRYEDEAVKFEHSNESYRQASEQALRGMAIFNPLIALTVNIGIVMILWVGGLRIDHGHMQAGQVVAFINYMQQILFSLMTISMVFNTFVRAKTSAGRITEVLAKPSRPTGAILPASGEHSAQAGKPCIQFDHVTFSYEGAAGEPVLHDLTFTIERGETVGIIGSTGSGKSTLVHLIPRFYDPTNGSVFVHGNDTKQVDPASLRSRMAIVPQQTVLFTGTIKDNIRWGNEAATPEQIEEAASVAAAHDFIAASPLGYDTIVGQGGVNFSGGQKQRLSIARALVRQPDILILDDCTSALDVVIEAKIKAALKKGAGKVTCLLIAQRMSSVMDADRIIVMDDGRIAGIGKHEELLLNCKVYQEIYRSQWGKENDQHAAAAQC